MYFEIGKKLSLYWSAVLSLKSGCDVIELRLTLLPAKLFAIPLLLRREYDGDNKPDVLFPLLLPFHKFSPPDGIEPTLLPIYYIMYYYHIYIYIFIDLSLNLVQMCRMQKVLETLYHIHWFLSVPCLLTKCWCFY